MTLGTHADPPEECIVSIEADVFTFRSPADAELIEGSIGEMSPFHQTFHYYARAVAEETATLPAGWKDPLIPFSTPATAGATALCLQVHDLAVSKLARTPKGSRLHPRPPAPQHRRPTHHCRTA